MWEQDYIRIYNTLLGKAARIYLITTTDDSSWMRAYCDESFNQLICVPSSTDSKTIVKISKFDDDMWEQDYIRIYNTLLGKAARIYLITTTDDSSWMRAYCDESFNQLICVPSSTDSKTM
ncbi:hypothetical protein FQR65_LT18373 [Abscondita terminalis]|nr:hypothetical protein FQR65_LT18373 [Abscondita terminalis]